MSGRMSIVGIIHRWERGSLDFDPRGEPLLEHQVKALVKLGAQTAVDLQFYENAPPEEMPDLIAHEVATVYGRPLSFVNAWLKNGKLPYELYDCEITVKWADVKAAHCGVPPRCEHLVIRDMRVLSRLVQERLAKHEASLREKAASERAAKVASVVYFIEAVSAGVVKIGTSTDVVGRLKTLKTGLAHPLRLVSVEPGNARRERELHQQFAAHRKLGEWFAIDREIVEYVNAVRATHARRIPAKKLKGEALPRGMVWEPLAP